METILVVNAGSSSVKFQIFAVGEAGEPRRLLRGQMDGIGVRPKLRAKGEDGSSLVDKEFATNEVPDVAAAMSAVRDWLRETQKSTLVAVGHRVVHGGPDFDKPVIVDEEVISRLESYVPLAPLHQPNNLAPIRLLLRTRSELPQVACFDTAFHRGHDSLADHFALPQHFYDEGIRRYGFHGLSYEYIAERLREIAPDVAAGRVIVAHLGSGASMCAIANGRSVESTMGFTALDGLPMGTRPGQIDPGVLLYLIMERGMEPSAVRDLLYRESGLRGMSGVSSDVRDLEASAAPAAAFAIEYFVYRIGLCCRDVGGRARRGRRIRVHSRYRRELADHAGTNRRETRMAWRIARSGRQCGEQDRHLSAREPDKALRRAHGRGAGDCSAHDLASVETPKGGRQGRDVKPDLVVARAAVVIRCLRHFVPAKATSSAHPSRARPCPATVALRRET